MVFTDMDQSTPIAEIPKLLAWFEQGYDVVIGSRLIQILEAETRHNAPAAARGFMAEIRAALDA